MIHVSMVMRCHDTETHPITFDEIWDAIRTGKHGLKEKITLIRNRYEAEKDITGSVEEAKKAIADLKGELPGFMSAGTFSRRANEALVEYSGILCADLDSLGEKLPFIRESLKSYPFVHAIALSPSGDGLKVFINVVKDPLRHEDSFRAIQKFFRDEAGIEIDEKCKDLARICFLTYDPDAWRRAEGNEIMPPADPLPRGRTTAAPSPDMTVREQIAFRLVGELRADPAKGGYFCRCPGESFHTNRTAGKHTILYLEGAPTLSCQHESCAHVVESFNNVLRSEIGRAESHVSYPPYRDVRHATLSVNGEHLAEGKLDKPLITFYSPKQLFAYIPPPDIQLIGDYHIVKDTGFVSVIGGPAGVGKSLTSTALAVAGTTGEGEWFGLKIHRKFKTMIIQTEDGMFRLSRNFKELDCDAMDDFVRICEPPPRGLAFRYEDFYLALRNEIAGFAPDMVIIDPFNSVARDQEQRTYLETIDLVRSALPLNTALVIIAHTRKPQPNERAVGRSLMNILAGSHVLVTIPRSVFVLQYASDDPEDDEVVWTCCKNNDGELGKRTAWKRKIGLFLPVPNFDWATFDGGDSDKRVVITAAMVEEVFDSGPLIRSLARDRLGEISGASKAACYRALHKDGRFADNLIFKGDTINWLRK
jgi:hypothetical protein